NLSLELAEAHYNTRSYFGGEGLERVLADDLMRDLGGYHPRDTMRQWFRPHAGLPPLEQMQAVDMGTWLPGGILVKADRTTMAYSLEARAPYLDYRLAELSGRLPARFKIAGRDRKHVFKRAMQPYVPNELLYRPKMGFSVPMAEWMRSSLKPRFQRLVLDG